MDAEAIRRGEATGKETAISRSLASAFGQCLKAVDEQYPEQRGAEAVPHSLTPVTRSVHFSLNILKSVRASVDIISSVCVRYATRSYKIRLYP
eukprot:COSAG02_NODE_509_length_20882_cov_71.811914_11_plen_93_part_00